jgi:hypothetical protein
MRQFRIPEIVTGFLLGFAALLIIFVFSSDITGQHEVCETTKEGAKECVKYGVLHFSLYEVGNALNSYNGLLTAIATAFIAWFTLSLRQSTDKLWDAGERALTKTERAFVYIDGFDFELSTLADGKQPIEFFGDQPEWHRSNPELVITRFALQPRWKNGGTTPTKNMTIQVNWRGPPGPVPPHEYNYKTAPEPFFLGPMAAEPSAVIDVPTAAAIVSWSMNPMGVEPFILIWGRADYQDIFGVKHFVEWCHRLRVSRPIRSERMQATTFQWGEHNRSDDA